MKEWLSWVEQMESEDGNVHKEKKMKKINIFMKYNFMKIVSMDMDN